MFCEKQMSNQDNPLSFCHLSNIGYLATSLIKRNIEINGKRHGLIPDLPGGGFMEMRCQHKWGESPNFLEINTELLDVLMFAHSCRIDRIALN